MRYDVRPVRLTFWVIMNVALWGLMFAAYPAARRAVYVGYEMAVELSLKHSPSQIMANIAEISARAEGVLASVAPVPGIFIASPIVMAIVMIAAPMIVRRDHRRPIRGVVLLPLMTIVCYLFTMLMCVVASSLVQMGIHWQLGTTPGPDFFIFMVQPLFLFMPFALGSVSGVLSQICYLLYIASVLSVRAVRTEARDAEESEQPRRAPRRDTSDEAAACDMEADRLCRMIAKKFGDVSLAHDIRCDIEVHITSPEQVRQDIAQGYEPYRIVLLESAKSLRKHIEGEPEREAPRCAFDFIVGEMERLNFCTAADARALRGWLAAKTPRGEAR